MIRNKSSVFDESALKCMVSLFCFFFRIPRLNALIPLNIGWPVSTNGCTINEATESHFPSGLLLKGSLPLLFVSWSKECPITLRESLRVSLDLFGIRNTFLWFSFYGLIDVVEQRLEDNSILKFFWTLTSQIFLAFLEHFQWGKPWENMPLELNRFSVNSK